MRDLIYFNKQNTSIYLVNIIVYKIKFEKLFIFNIKILEFFQSIFK